MSKKTNELTKLRREIDSVDLGILESIAKRTRLVRSIGEYKLANGLKPLDAKRKRELKKTWIEAGTSMHLPARFVSDLYKRVHDHSVSIERKVGKKHGKSKPR